MIQSLWEDKDLSVGLPNVGLLRKDGGQQCHKIYRQRAGKNPDIALDGLTPLASIIECDKQGGLL